MNVGTGLRVVLRPVKFAADDWETFQRLDIWDLLVLQRPATYAQLADKELVAKSQMQFRVFRCKEATCQVGSVTKRPVIS